jgi:hypothetical protein
VSLWSAEQLADLRAAQVALMDDACQVGTIATTQNSIGELAAAAPSYGREVVCGIQMVTESRVAAEYRTAEGSIAKADARLRLPHGTAVTLHDVVKVTKRQGSAITPLVYEVVSEPAVGVTAVTCFLTRTDT